MKKFNKKIMLYIFLIIPFFKPGFFDFVPFLDNVYKILFITSCLIIFYLCYKKKCISKFTIFTFFFEFIFFCSCLINKNLTIYALKSMVEIVTVTLLINYGLKYDCKYFLKSILILLEILICANFITIILFPNGMYDNLVTRMTDNFLLGIDNLHIVYFLIFWIVLYIYNYIYNENNIFNIVSLLISVVSILIRWSATTLVGSSIIILYFMLYKYIDNSKFNSIKNYIIAYIILYFGIIFFRLQSLFSFVIVNILKKDITFTRRTAIWDAVMNQIKNKPLLGHGMVPIEFRQLLNLGTHAHNLFLEIVYEGGILYLMLFLYLVYMVYKKMKQYYDYKITKVLMLFVFAFFFMMLVEAYTFSHIIFLLAMCYSIEIIINEFKCNCTSTLKNEVIVIGGNHHNMLGVNRVLGEKNVYPNIIVTNDDKYAYVIKSKYVKNFDIVKENEQEIKDILLKKYSILKDKAILIPTSDFAALFIDKNLNELKENFIVPNINNKQNEIKKYMDKNNQSKLAKKYDIKIAKTLKLNLSKKIDYNDKKIPIPCILKPIISALGFKNDIEICETNEELKISIENLRKKGYSEVLLQEYLNYDNEYLIDGCINDKKIICPGLVEKERIYPLKKGTTSYAKITEINKFKSQINKYKKMLKDLNYSGIFDIEFFEVGNDIYLNEINFRNGAPSYSFTYGNVWIIYIWVLMVTSNDISKENISVKKEFYFQDEIRELKHLLHKNISFKEYFKSLKNTNIFLVLNIKDITPVIYKFIYANLRRIRK